MRETVLSLSERKFITDSIKATHRLDGRAAYDYRKIRISFGDELGHVEVQLGQTRVLCQVSCSVARPFPDRPAEGFIQFNTELSQMAAPSFESGRGSELAVEIGRVVERGLRESRAIETEGLCIVAGEKVWSVRVDVTILDHCGNLVDAAMVAATTALRAFRRPDVSVSGEDVTIHTVQEKEPVPLAIHHFPLAVTFAFFADGEHLVVDPSLQEERVMDGRMSVVMNNFREICAVHKAGGVLLSAEQMVRCAKIAAVKAIEMNEMIQAALDEHTGDKARRMPTRETGQRLIGANIVTNTTTDAPLDAEAGQAGGTQSERAKAGQALFDGSGGAWDDADNQAPRQGLGLGQGPRGADDVEGMDVDEDGSGSGSEESDDSEEDETATLQLGVGR